MKYFKLFTIIFIMFIIGYLMYLTDTLPINLPALTSKNPETIKWVDFDVPYEALDTAMKLDIESYEQEVHMDWLDTLAFLGAKYGGDFSNYRTADINDFANHLRQGDDISDLTKHLKYFDYYKKAYGAALGELLGEYKVQVPIAKAHDDSSAFGLAENEGRVSWVEKYGLKAFSPIADGYWYNDYDDFGAGRSYGYNRKHYGHDLMVDTGTPVIAIESGIVEATGWNQYGGWRIGIRSFDGQRYYYYAHLRKDHPYNDKLHAGQTVKAGDVIGYSGRTGYSIKENVNNIDTPHLHVGMQLIFDETEKDSPNQIWIDMYNITRLLSQNKSPVYKDEAKGEYYRKYDFSEESYYKQQQLIDDAKESIDDYSSIEFIVSDVPKISNVPDISTVSALADLNVPSLKKDAVPEGIPVPIIMYHGFVTAANQKTKYFIDPKYFEGDLKYLQSSGYTTVSMTDLINYVEKGRPLPQKPIVLTFDDGYYNNYYYAYPLLRQYNMKGVLSIIGKFTDEFSLFGANHINYSHVTWDQVNEMIASGNMEIQNHTYDLHSYGSGRKGTMQNPGESKEAYTAFLKKDLELLQEKMNENTGFTPNTFTYPFGYMSKGSRDILKGIGFKSSLSCAQGINYITRDSACLFQMKRYLRPPNISSYRYFKNIEDDMT